MAEQLTDLTSKLKDATAKQLVQAMSELPRQRLLSVVLGVLPAFEVEQLEELIDRAEDAIEQIEILGDFAGQPEYSVVKKPVKGKLYAYVRNRDRSVELGLGRIIFELGKTYRICHKVTGLSKLLRCLRIYIPPHVNPSIERKAYMDIEYLDSAGTVLKRATHDFPDHMKTVFSDKQWIIEEVSLAAAESNSDPTIAVPYHLPRGRLDVSAVSSTSTRAQAAVLIPENFSNRIVKTLERWVAISQTSSGGNWMLARATVNDHVQVTLLNGRSQEIIVYRFATREILLLVLPSVLLTLLEEIAREGLQSGKRLRAEEARRLLLQLQSTPADNGELTLKTLFGI
jgi:hypothetical protein